jgi:hypothetical protein
MPAEAYWIEDQRILSISYNGHIGVDDMRGVIAVCVGTLSSTPIHFLVDFTQMTSFDPQIIEMSSFSEWLYHPNARWFAYVRLAGLYKSLIQHRHDNNIKFFQERIEAETFLRQAAQAVPER